MPLRRCRQGEGGDGEKGEKKCVTRRKVTWRSRRKVEFVGAREKFVGLCVTWPMNLNFTCHASLKFVGLADELKRHASNGPTRKFVGPVMWPIRRVDFRPTNLGYLNSSAALRPTNLV